MTGPEIVERFNVFPSARFIGGAGAGLQLGRCDHGDGRSGRQSAARGLHARLVRASRTRRRSSGQNTLGIFVLAVLMVFLILAAQYERWTLPFAVILAVPFAVFGAFLAVWLRGL